MQNMLQHTSATPRDLPFMFLQHITDNFSKERIIGRGGYGEVYKGVLDNGDEIAVKKLHCQPGLDGNQFKNELLNLMMLQHENIIRLVGYCSETRDIVVEYNGKLVLASVEERALCLEYMQGGNLDEHISDESCGLDWKVRYKIIEGICEGLKYLHTGSKDPIYHLDLKPANILLDKDMTPKIGDFGLSRLLGTHTCVTNTLIGTRGYMPPEYIDGHYISPKFDVFSLGVIIIQVIAGKEGYYKYPAMTSQEFIDLVTENWRKRAEAETMPPDALQQIQACVKIALRCIKPKRLKRPTITEVVEELNMIDLTNWSPYTLASETSHSQKLYPARKEPPGRTQMSPEDIYKEIEAMRSPPLLPHGWLLRAYPMPPNMEMLLDEILMERKTAVAIGIGGGGFVLKYRDSEVLVLKTGLESRLQFV